MYPRKSSTLLEIVVKWKNRGRILGQNTVKRNRKNFKVSTKHWQIFCERTSFSTLSHINSREKPIKKVVWIVTLVVGLIMIAIQTYDVFNEYVNRTVIYARSRSENSTLPFPLVTFCSNQIVDFDLFHDRDTPPELKALLQQYHHCLKSTECKSTDVKKDIQNYMIYLEKEDGLKFNSLVSHINWFDQINTFCSIFGEPCGEKFKRKIYFHPFYHVTFGNCVNINPGIEKGIHARNNLELTFIVKIGGRSRKTLLNRDYFLLSLHPPQSAAVLSQADWITIADNAATQVQMRVTHRKRVKNCIDDSDHASRLRSLYYEYEFNYTYSQEACYSSCYMHAEFQTHRFLSDAYMTIVNKMKKYYNYTGDITSCAFPDCILLINTSKPDISSCFQKCLPRCNDYVYNYDVLKHPYTNEDVQFYRTLKRYNLSEVFFNSEAITIAFRSTQFETLEEKYKYTLIYADKFNQLNIEWKREWTQLKRQSKVQVSDLIGIAGGNLGLWLGLCVISIFELVEFLVDLVYFSLFKTLKKFL